MEAVATRLHLVSQSQFYIKNLVFSNVFFSLRYEPPPMDPTMVGSHWDLEDRVVEYRPQLGGDHTITKRTCSFSVTNDLGLNVCV